MAELSFCPVADLHQSGDRRADAGRRESGVRARPRQCAAARHHSVRRGTEARPRRAPPAGRQTPDPRRRRLRRRSRRGGAPGLRPAAAPAGRGRFRSGQAGGRARPRHPRSLGRGPDPALARHPRTDGADQRRPARPAFAIPDLYPHQILRPRAPLPSRPGILDPVLRAGRAQRRPADPDAARGDGAAGPFRHGVGRAEHGGADQRQRGLETGDAGGPCRFLRGLPADGRPDHDGDRSRHDRFARHDQNLRAGAEFARGADARNQPRDGSLLSDARGPSQAIADPASADFHQPDAARPRRGDSDQPPAAGAPAHAAGEPQRAGGRRCRAGSVAAAPPRRAGRHAVGLGRSARPDAGAPPGGTAAGGKQRAQPRRDRGLRGGDLGVRGGRSLRAAQRRLCGVDRRHHRRAGGAEFPRHPGLAPDRHPGGGARDAAHRDAVPHRQPSRHLVRARAVDRRAVRAHNARGAA